MDRDWGRRIEQKHPHIKVEELVGHLLKNKKKKKNINSYFKKLRSCSTKSMLHDCLLKMSIFSKKVLEFYLTECFILDVFSRKVSNKIELFRKREFFLNCIDDPDLLLKRFNFDNNLVKNFCIGAVNFISRYYSDISKQILDAKA
jgi:hypothetical protein